MVLGGRADRELGQLIAAAAPGRCLDLTGQTTLRETIECLRRSAVVISNDTGPMHIAAALRRPLVTLFGPTEPRRTGPYGQPESVLQTALDCVPCMSGDCGHIRPLECLRSIPPETVVGRVRARLESSVQASEEWRL
jgi:ADP-heptose:LPS heptosyltransferase